MNYYDLLFDVLSIAWALLCIINLEELSLGLEVSILLRTYPDVQIVVNRRH